MRDKDNVSSRTGAKSTETNAFIHGTKFLKSDRAEKIDVELEVTTESLQFSTRTPGAHAGTSKVHFLIRGFEVVAIAAKRARRIYRLCISRGLYIFDHICCSIASLYHCLSKIYSMLSTSKISI
jgi:hypothetical protein